jgi:hypothetical protein
MSRHSKSDDVVLLKCGHITAGHVIITHLGEKGKDRTWCDVCQNEALIVRMATIQEILGWLDNRESAISIPNGDSRCGYAQNARPGGKSQTDGSQTLFDTP